MTAPAPAGLPVLIPTATVAAILSVSTATFLRRLDQLIEDDGFPEPMPHSRAPFLFRRDRVLAWIEEQGLPRTPGRSGANVVILSEARRA